jgi:hypothetical protein
MKTMRWLAGAVLAASALLLNGCGGSDGPSFNMQDMHGGLTKAWRYAAVTSDFNPEGGIPISGSDDIFIVNRDGTAMVARGEIDAAPTDTIKVDFYNWTVDGDKLTMGNLAQGNIEAKITTLNEGLLVYEMTVQGFLVKFVFVPVVYPNPFASAKNKALTNGMSKLWQVTSMTRDGAAFPIPAHRQDDMWLFNTNGGGMFLKGEVQAVPGDLTNNDSFIWQFTDSETKLDIEAFEHGSTEVSDRNIIELTPDRFVYEATMLVDGVVSLFRMTAVPVVKAAP